MPRKYSLLFGLGLVIGFISLLCFLFIHSETKKINKSKNFFDMSIEELMKIEITASAPKEEKQAYFPQKRQKPVESQTTDVNPKTTQSLA